MMFLASCGGAPPEATTAEHGSPGVDVGSVDARCVLPAASVIRSDAAAVRVTNGFYTFVVDGRDLGRFRSR